MPDTRDAMLAAINMPMTASLTRYGYGVPNERKKTSVEITNGIHAGRLELLSEQSLTEFAKARLWLRKFGKHSRLNKNGTTRHLLPLIERDIGPIAEGVLIAAAVAEGFRVERTGNWKSCAYLDIVDQAFEFPWLQPGWTQDTGIPGR